MSEVELQERKADVMRPVIGGMMGIIMILVLVQLIQAAPPGTANLDGHVRDEEGNLIDGASVNLNGNVASTVSGYYSFSNVPLGTYTLQVSKTGYQAKTIPISMPTAGSYTQDVVLMAPPSPNLANLSGVVRNYQTGALIEGATVTLDTDEDTTDINGIYSFGNKDPGAYTLTASKDGFTTKTKSVTLAAGDNTEDIYLSPEGVPAPEFAVSNLGITPSEVAVGGTVVIGADVKNIGDAAGSYTVTCNVTPGTYTSLAVVPTAIPWEDLTSLMVVMMFMAMIAGMTKGVVK